ncbi:MAG: DUF1028 domain-containing protein [Anaerolineae bacterium]
MSSRCEELVATFSIVACDLEKREWGVAVQSKFLAVGALVPWARAEVGAVATQAWANLSYGPRGLELMAKGKSAREALEALIAEDEGRAKRQVGLVDSKGRAAAFTGEECFPWAGHVVGPNYACQGNILVSEATVEAMARAFEETQGILADRLVAALLAGQAAGGDSRGQQSAALLVVKEKGSYGGYTDRYIDLRVDEHLTPIEELKRILKLHKIYLSKTDPADLMKIDEKIAREIQEILKRSGDYDGELSGLYDERTREALTNYCLRENLEERLQEGNYIDRVVLEYMRGNIE